MDSDRFAPAQRVRRRPVSARRVGVILPLVIGLLACFAASAQAHTGSATTSCGVMTGNSVTLNWVDFANPAGAGNGGMNTPDWTVAYTPSGGGATTTKTGTVSFPLNSYSLTVAIPSGPGSVVVSSAWTSAQTTDGDTGTWTDQLTAADCLGATAITTTASASSKDGVIHDSAVLSDGRAPTGHITFKLYKSSDRTCSTPLTSRTVSVSGNGTYTSPDVTEDNSGRYQWTASYSGDADNASATDPCNEKGEQVTVPVQIVKDICVSSGARLTGVIGKVRKSFTAHLTGLGIRNVTFYLDGHRLKTVTGSRDRFSLKISARKLSYGSHRLVARAKMKNHNCAEAARAGTFVKVRSNVTVPVFTG